LGWCRFSGRVLARPHGYGVRTRPTRMDRTQSRKTRARFKKRSAIKAQASAIKQQNSQKSSLARFAT
jgi:hypothetical protein